LGERDEDDVADGLDAEGRVTGRGVRIHELSDQGGVGSEDVHGSLFEVRSQQYPSVARGRGEGHAFVDVVVTAGNQDFGGCAEGAAPAGDGAVFADEEEKIAMETADGVECLAGWVACAGDRDLQGLLHDVSDSG